ncbi:hypothetical protein ACQ5SO_04690 [Rhodovulum sp. DZ06]|uniref:hypothetical protein n=1 Tax=Rhodovulum sp. DZ06 TaxID=3425126 RepID=UPI003D32B7F5
MISHRLPARAALCALLLAAPAAAARAEEPAPYAALSVGAHYGLEYASGYQVTLVLEEKSDSGTVWGVVPGVDPAGEVAARMVQDAKGRMTAFLSADGAALETYQPHNCERVELLCRYTVTDETGAHVEQRFSEFDGTEWTYSILRKTEDGFVGKRLGSVRYDADGVQMEAEWADLKTGETNSVSRVE